MDIIITIFGEGKDLTIGQVIARAIAIFLITLILIRISGRRSFGVKTPLDNIIVILLGALLSRAIAGVSPFVPVVAASFTLVIIHRLLGRIISHSKKFKKVIESEKILLFKEGKFIDENLKKALVNEEDVLSGVRTVALTDELSKVDRIFMESSGKFSIIQKA